MRATSPLAALALLALAAPRLHAQQPAGRSDSAAAPAAPKAAWPLATGTWSGMMVPPNGRTLPVTYEVARVGDSLAVNMAAPFGMFPLRRVRLEREHLRFEWTADEEITCDLAPQPGGGFAGQCVDPMGAPGQLSMLPPASPAAPAK